MRIKTSGVSKQKTTHRPISMTTMIIRSLLRVQVPKTAGRRFIRIPSQPVKATRRYSTSSPTMASTPQSQASMLATITTDLDKIAPRFEIQPEQITIIQTPAEFYKTLKVGTFSVIVFSYHSICTFSMIASCSCFSPLIFTSSSHGTLNCHHNDLYDLFSFYPDSRRTVPRDIT